ncbi:MAG TPA: hypothetical protein VJH91_02870 [Candidatus Paceibacterota bacterium]
MVKKVVRKVRRLVRKSKPNSQLAPEESERLLHWFKAVPELERIADSERQNSEHYDGFGVGVSALLRRSDGTTYTVSGANEKKAPGPRQAGDHCAEDCMYHGDEVIGFVSIAPHKIDDFSEFDLGVTISCGHCRKRFRKFDPADGIRSHTRARFINPAHRERPPVELRVDYLLKLCEKKDQQNGHH